ncbi:hypothetical protein F511_03507 [Dorcoceras hygrometricum]|uniref:Uncharacterized protein n=1 Tax=Dorcoceras hygrometricum TaxID=472368 RepID=A0A2Z7ATI7_9LAMI|nr:hypothetical protein F511_03507 [Dorcoceras hygrometricum]
MTILGTVSTETITGSYQLNPTLSYPSNTTNSSKRRVREDLALTRKHYLNGRPNRPEYEPTTHCSSFAFTLLAIQSLQKRYRKKRLGKENSMLPTSLKAGFQLVPAQISALYQIWTPLRYTRFGSSPLPPNDVAQESAQNDQLTALSSPADVTKRRRTATKLRMTSSLMRRPAHTRLDLTSDGAYEPYWFTLKPRTRPIHTVLTDFYLQSWFPPKRRRFATRSEYPALSTQNGLRQQFLSTNQPDLTVILKPDQSYFTHEPASSPSDLMPTPD